MRKSIAWLMILVIVFGLLSGCRQNSDTPDTTEPQGEDIIPEETKPKDDDLLETVNPGKLTVVTCADYAPYAFYAASGGNSVLAGLDISIARYIADHCGLQLEIIVMDADDILTEISVGNADIALAGFPADAVYEDYMAVSDVYYEDKQCMVVRADETGYASIGDINKSGKKIGVQSASVQYDLARKTVNGATVVELNTAAEVIDRLCNGKLDGAIVETAVANNYIANGAKLTILSEISHDTQPAVIGVAKGNDALLEAVNQAVQAAIKDGSMDRFVAQVNALTPQ